MENPRVIEQRYVDGSYLAANPEWDRADAPWKAALVASILKENRVAPASICDVGCGSGDVLRELRALFPTTALSGFDVSPQLETFWSRVEGVQFQCGQFEKMPPEGFDVMLLLDVFEHVRDPFTMLENARRHAKHFVFHIPLDLSAVSVLRGGPLMYARHKVGHLHFYTKDLALETLTDCGFSIVEWRYTEAFASLVTHHTWKTRLAHLPRRLAAHIHRDTAVRLFGGETLLVLAK